MFDFQFKPNRVISTDLRFRNRDVPSKELLQAINVPESMAEWVRVLDRQGDLALLHYLTTTNSDGTVNVEPMNVVGHVRGIIVNEATGEIVCQSFPFTPEILVDDVNEVLPTFSEEMVLYPSCEGTVIRLFYDDVWRISTHRKIDADGSCWSGPTFGSMFRELFEDFDSLDTNFCYTLLMSHNKNRLIYEVPKPQLLLVTVYNRQEKCFLSSTELYELPEYGWKYPVQIDGILTGEDLQRTVNEYVPSFAFTGVIVLTDTKVSPKPIKFVSQRYLDLRTARGNEPCIRDRYIQVRGTEDEKILREWYTDEAHVFEKVEYHFDKLVFRIHRMYLNRYIGKRLNTLPKEEFVTIQRCHAWHCENRKENIVTQEKVREFLNTTPNYYILIMLNRQLTS